MHFYHILYFTKISLPIKNHKISKSFSHWLLGYKPVPDLKHLGYDKSLRWRHNEHDSVSNHQPHDCLLNRLFGRRSKKTSKLRVTGLCAGIHRGPVNSPHKGPVTRKMFPFDDAIMYRSASSMCVYTNLYMDSERGCKFLKIPLLKLMLW